MDSMPDTLEFAGIDGLEFAGFDGLECFWNQFHGLPQLLHCFKVCICKDCEPKQSRNDDGLRFLTPKAWRDRQDKPGHEARWLWTMGDSSEYFRLRAGISSESNVQKSHNVPEIPILDPDKNVIPAHDKNLTGDLDKSGKARDTVGLETDRDATATSSVASRQTIPVSNGNKTHTARPVTDDAGSAQTAKETPVRTDGALKPGTHCLQVYAIVAHAASSDPGGSDEPTRKHSDEDAPVIAKGEGVVAPAEDVVASAEDAAATAARVAAVVQIKTGIYKRRGRPLSSRVDVLEGLYLALLDAAAKDPGKPITDYLNKTTLADLGFAVNTNPTKSSKGGHSQPVPSEASEDRPKGKGDT